MKTFPSHVAILVPSVRKAAENLRRFDFQIQKKYGKILYLKDLFNG